MLSTPSLSQNCINLIDENNSWLQLPRETEHGTNKLVAVAVPFLCEGRDVQVDEDGARFVSESFGKHCLAAARRAVEKNTRRSGE